MRNGPGLSSDPPGPDKIKWCPECGRYYTQDAPHDCHMKEIKLNRSKLEGWLGKFKIKED